MLPWNHPTICFVNCLYLFGKILLYTTKQLELLVLTSLNPSVKHGRPNLSIQKGVQWWFGDLIEIQGTQQAKYSLLKVFNVKSKRHKEFQVEKYEGWLFLHVNEMHAENALVNKIYSRNESVANKYERQNWLFIFVANIIFEVSSAHAKFSRHLTWNDKLKC